jgi:hypothetical protein
MIKKLFAVMLLLTVVGVLFLTPGVAAESQAPIQIVEIMMPHGPMQPTLRAVDEVVAKYGDKVNLTKYDITAVEGGKYAKDNGITAHFDLFINGKDTYVNNGTTVTFQWFEGEGWKKADLDAAIAAELNPPGKTPQNPGPAQTQASPLSPMVSFLAVLIAGLVGCSCTWLKHKE